ncbi:penicillin-binding transpeptidase domain-containing protein [Vibrio cholerae]|uniref:Penicillin-binding protein n=1 Tax=Vibrio metoecus TaxID=1481663 RepID=A0A271VRN1_VIBMT|nr:MULTISPECIES: penicillin-binding transpeptidase domain-containing protein [Vibrio]EGS58062.1 penicillin binding transpeptidase domain protein [Vibrio paracholerae HE-09]EKG87746.1 penicillin binding transpeptidase domain protein [Vibrio paracholerae HE-16]EMP92337.1 penicillin binding transpeptidase domain protein [Vibrio paracholerae 87395]KQB09801.1 penicillin-binding protein [Vibrio metoecus]MBW5417395.1 penicillin-binding protein [Vibrio cholerae]
MSDRIVQARRALILEQIAGNSSSKLLFRHINKLGFSAEARTLAIAVMKVESTARPWWFRLVEATVAMVSAVLSLLTGHLPRNYTVGPLQVGIKTSLEWTNSELTPFNYIRRLCLLLQARGSLRIFRCGYRFHLRSIRADKTSLLEFSEFYNGKQSIKNSSVPYHEALLVAIESIKGASIIDIARNDNRLNIMQTDSGKDAALSIEQAVKKRLHSIQESSEDGELISAVVVLCSNKARKVIHSIYVGPDVKQQPALQQRRLVGSILKVPLYTCYIEQFKSTINETFKDKPIKVISDGQVLQPRNADHKYRGPVTVKYSFAYSINTVALQILEKLKVERFISYLRKSGVHIPLPNSLLLALGAVHLTIWEVLALFSPIMTGGYLSWVSNGDSRQVFPLNNGARISSRSTIETMRVLLKETAVDGTAGYLLNKDPHSLGGKTGTSEKNRDLWFVGAIDEDTYGAVWIGRHDGQPLVANDHIPISASRFAVPMWSDVVSAYKECTR